MYTNIHVHVHKYTRAYRHLCKHATPRFFFEFYFQNKIENDTNRHLCKHSSTGVHSRNVGQKQRAYIPPTSPCGTLSAPIQTRDRVRAPCQRAAPAPTLSRRRRARPVLPAAGGRRRSNPADTMRAACRCLSTRRPAGRPNAATSAGNNRLQMLDFAQTVGPRYQRNSLHSRHNCSGWDL